MQLSIHELDVMELKENMDSLYLGDTNMNDGPPESEDKSNKPNIRRSPRNFVRPLDISTPKIKKKVDSERTIEKIYLSKTVKRLPSTLETIYEEPKSLNGSVQHMSTRKFKRVVNFQENDSPLHRQKRTKHRMLKAKKVIAPARVKMRKKIAMEMLKEKLHELSDCEA